MTTLKPRAGERYLSPMEVLTRVQAEFAYVEASEEGARDQVLACVDRLVFPAEYGRAAGHGPAAEDGWATEDAQAAADALVAAAGRYAVQLERFQSAARLIHFSDDLGSDGVLVSMLMIPRQPLIIEDHADDEKTWFLIFRAAEALDYEVLEPESEAAEPGMDSAGSGEYAAAA